MRDLLLQRLHNVYKFPGGDPEEEPPNDKNFQLINEKAMVKFSKALAQWKHKVRAKLDKGATYEEVHEKWHSINRGQFEVFKNNILDPDTIALRAWGKELQSKNIGPQHLGSNGYHGKELVWAKEEIEFAKMGIENPLGTYSKTQWPVPSSGPDTIGIQRRRNFARAIRSRISRKNW